MWIKQEYTLKKTSFDRAIKPVLNQSELKLNNSSMSIDLGGGNVRLALNKENQVEHDILINYLFYKSYQADNSQTSGAYIFRPSEPDQLPENYNFFFHYESFQGKFVAQYKLYGDEIEACITANIYSDFIEVETNLIGIPFTGQGTEVIINFSVDEITNNGVFYTDSMGLEMQKRVIDYRPSWDLIVTQPISENYYPATHGVIIKDNNLTLEILNDRSQGVSSLENGDVEFMIQRRTYRDDFRGVGEPLNEVDSENPFDRGSSVTTRHFFRIYNNSETYAINQNSRWMQREIDVPLIYVYGTKKVVQTNYTELFKSSNNIFDLADDIKAVFLPQKDGSLFVRFENILDLISANHTSTVNVTAVAKYISKMTNNEVNEVYEVSNTGLFTMVEMQQLKLKWRATDFTSPVADYSSDSSSIELGPQRIRSFVISFSKKTFDNILTINSSY